MHLLLYFDACLPTCCVLVVRSPYFKASFASGQAMQEEASHAAGKAISMNELRVGAFRVLLWCFNTHQLLEGGGRGEELKVGEIVGVADRLQQSVPILRGAEGMKVSNVIERLVLAHDS